MGFKNIYTKLAGFFIVAIVLFFQFAEQQWDDKERVIASDVQGYYGYLPAIFIHNDLSLEHPEKFGGKIWYRENKEGKRYIKYTCGMAIMYSPFFFTAHVFASTLGEKADGYSRPYRFALSMAAIFYLTLALVFLSKFLLLYFKDKTVAVTLLVLFTGTNLWHYYILDVALSHGYSFCLLSVFLYCAARWLSHPKLKWALWMGVSAGLMVLIRPIDIVFLLFLPLFNVNSLSCIKERFALFFKYKVHVAIGGVLFCLVLLPQILYYKHILGSLSVYPYTNESFFFLHPHLFDSVFSYRNGWLVYSPLMVFSILGVLLLGKLFKGARILVLTVFSVYFYLIASWWCWWYVGFGNRAFINLYPILSIPLVCLVQFVMSKKLMFQIAFYSIIIAGIVLNVFQSSQVQKHAMHWGAMTKDAYWETFAKNSPTQLFASYLRFPVTERALQGTDEVYVPVYDTVYSIHKSFDQPVPNDSVFSPFLTEKKSFKGRGSLFIPKDSLFTLEHYVSVADANRLYFTAWTKNADELVLVLSGYDTIPFYSASDEVYKTKNNWDKIHLYTTLPDDFVPDSLFFYLWNKGNKNFWIDELHVTATFCNYVEKVE